MGTIDGSGRRPLLAHTSKTARTVAAIGAATLGLTALLAGAPRADAAVTCSYDGVFKLVTIEFGAHDDDEVELVAEAFAVEPRVIAAA
jgi:hypothetical protein